MNYNWNMNGQFNKYWIIVAVIIIANIVIFKNLSKKVETFVVDKTVEDNLADLRN